MRGILSICNFSSPCSAILIAVLLIGGTEIIFSVLLPSRFFSHEVDSILYEVKNKSMKADYILLGDSVGRQILQPLKGYKKFAFLASNAAIEMTGQYFLTKRFLQNNPAPKGVIFSGLPCFLTGNLDQPYTENYILRTFNDFDEILDILITKKNVSQTAKALCYKLFPSFKYRLHLQKLILGVTNADIYSGVSKKIGEETPKNYSLSEIIKKYQGQKVSLYHFRRLIELLTDRGIHFYYIPVPTKRPRKADESFAQDYRDLFTLLKAWEKEGMNISFYNYIIEYPERMFIDEAHLNKEGLIEARRYLAGAFNTQ